jgi:hypothetical protein
MAINPFLVAAEAVIHPIMAVLDDFDDIGEAIYPDEDKVDIERIIARAECLGENLAVAIAAGTR